MKKSLLKFCLTALLCVLISLNINSEALADANSDQIGRIETSLWGFEYKGENDSQRLKRIENSVFGSSDAKSSVQKRIDKLNQTLGFETQAEAKSSLGELSDLEVEGVTYPQVDKLELDLFGKVWANENIYKRLERLEKKVFGAAQKGDLALRTDTLKAAVEKETTSDTVYRQDKTAQRSYGQSYNPYETYESDMSDIHLQLSGLESTMFGGKTFSQDPIGLRLNRLERKIFQRDFSTDDEVTRLERLKAASQAKKTAKYYDGNKLQKFTSTGIQVGTLVLMILAFIL